MPLVSTWDNEENRRMFKRVREARIQKYGRTAWQKYYQNMLFPEYLGFTLGNPPTTIQDVKKHGGYYRWAKNKFKEWE